MRPLDYIVTRAVPIEVGEDGGSFTMRSVVDGGELRIIASYGAGWDHVSVHHHRRIPNWLEMEQVARVFFRDDEYAMQLHVPSTDHINVHPRVLHWWRPQDVVIPTPPKKLV